LQDDYVKFIRKIEDFIASSKTGVLAYINNNGFIDNPTFRGMRWHLLESFDEIYILNLHGNARKNDSVRIGSKDENVFNIMQGVSINIFVKFNKKKDNVLGKVFYADITGTKKEKLSFLSNYGKNDSKFIELQPATPFFFFIPQDRNGIEEYEKGFAINKLMPTCVTGVVTARDGLVIDMYRETLLEKIETFTDKSKTDNEVRQIFFGNKKTGKYLPGDSRGWSLKAARNKIRNNNHVQMIIPLAFRVLDNRYIYYSPDMVDWGREEIYYHIINKDNYCLVVPRQTTKNWGSPAKPCV